MFAIGNFVSTKGDWGDHESLLQQFVGIREFVANTPPDDLPWSSGHRFWIVLRGGEPILAFTCESGLAFNRQQHKPVSVMEKYVEYRRDLLFTSAKLLRFAEGL
jgi:hypothetical protein